RAEKHFETVRALNPEDPRVQRWTEGFRTGQGDANDPALVQAVMLRHLAKNELDASAEEARKLVQTYPDNWEARCVLLHHALRQNQTAEIKEHLAALPWAREIRGFLDPGTILHAFYLFHELNEGERVRDLVDYLMRQLLP